MKLRLDLDADKARGEDQKSNLGKEIARIRRAEGPENS